VVTIRYVRFTLFKHPPKANFGCLLKDGIEACGTKIASQLARLHFGQDLLHAAESGQDISGQMNEWRQNLRRELLINHSRRLTSRHPKLSGNIPDDFPDLKVLRLFTHPATHSGDFAGPSCTDIQAVQLTELAAVTFEWGRSVTKLFNRYRDLLFPAMALRQLVQAAVEIDKGYSEAGCTCCPIIGEIVGERAVHSTCFLPEFRCLLLIPSKLISDICASLPGPALAESTIAEIERDCQKYRAWLPQAMVGVVRPDLVSTYKGSASSMCCLIVVFPCFVYFHFPQSIIYCCAPKEIRVMRLRYVSVLFNISS